MNHVAEIKMKESQIVTESLFSLIRTVCHYQRVLVLGRKVLSFGDEIQLDKTEPAIREKKR